jgi:hypothetical protein
LLSFAWEGAEKLKDLKVVLFAFMRSKVDMVQQMKVIWMHTRA